MNDKPAGDSWARLKRAWGAIRQVLSIRGLLQWLGLWKHIPLMLTALTSVALGVWGHLRGLPGPIVAVLGLACFFLLTFIGGIVLNLLSPVSTKETSGKEHRTDSKAPDSAKPCFALEALDDEIHSYSGPRTYFTIRNCGQRTARNLRFDRILSKSTLRGLQFDTISSIAPEEKLPLGFHAGVNDDWIIEGNANQIILFCEDNPAKEPKLTYSILLRFLDGDKECTERHELECKQLHPSGARLKIYPALLAA